MSQRLTGEPGPSLEDAGTVRADELLRRMYKRSSRYFIERYGLLDLAVDDCPSTLTDFYQIQNGIAFAATAGARSLAATDTVVVGGPCIDHCEAQPTQLTIQVAVDIVSPLALAAFLQTDCVI